MWPSVDSEYLPRWYSRPGLVWPEAAGGLCADQTKEGARRAHTHHRLSPQGMHQNVQVVRPDSYLHPPDYFFLIQCFVSVFIWSGSRNLGWIQIRFQSGSRVFFFFKNYGTIYLFLGLHKGRPSYRRSLQPSKENVQYLKHEMSYPVTDPLTWLNQDPDPKH